MSVDSKEKVLDDFSLYIHDFVEILNSLQEAGLPHTIDISKTAFSPDHHLEDDFLKKAIASHIMTCGHTVVLGKIPERINLLISTLGMFLFPQERLISRYIHEDQGWSYQSNFALQGLLLDDNNQKRLYVNEVLSATYPSTVISLPSREIHQTPLCHEHIIRRHEMMISELTALMSQLEKRQSDVYPTNEIFQAVEYKETLVTHFFNDLNLLPNVCGAIEEYIEQFRRQLEIKALTLIKYAEQETQKGRLPFKTSTKKLRQYLSLPEHGDLLMVLATAEKLKPGLYSIIMSDGKRERIK